MRWLIVAVVVSARVASADPAIGLHVGGGLPISPDERGETSSLLVGGALGLEREGRWWAPRFALDVRRMNFADVVPVAFHTTASDIRGIGVRGLAGLRIQTQSSVRLFGQLSVGLEWQRASWEEFLLIPLLDLSKLEARHDSGMAGVFESALGAAVRSGHAILGVQAAVAMLSTTHLPSAAGDKNPLDLIVTVFVEHRR